MPTDVDCADLQRRLVVLEGKLDALESQLHQRWEDHNKALDNLGFQGMLDDVEELQLYVYGDKKLGIEPLRPMVDNLNRAYMRAKWVGGALATSNFGAIVTWVNTLLN
jgi:hypothetical protein